MDIVSRGSAERRGQKVDEEKLAFQKSMFKALVEEQVLFYFILFYFILFYSFILLFISASQ